MTRKLGAPLGHHEPAIDARPPFVQPDARPTIDGALHTATGNYHCTSIGPTMTVLRIQSPGIDSAIRRCSMGRPIFLTYPEPSTTQDRIMQGRGPAGERRSWKEAFPDGTTGEKTGNGKPARKGGMTQKTQFYSFLHFVLSLLAATGPTRKQNSTLRRGVFFFPSFIYIHHFTFLR